ncbi:MAG: glycosyltransferase family 4 protein [Ginsengibacter sp.]
MDEHNRILFGITKQSHTEMGLDEMRGLQKLGYQCDQFEYAGNKESKSTIARFYLVIRNAIKLLIKTYQFKPDYIYFNSRLEDIACKRDFITIFILRSFYYKKVLLLIKSHGSEPEVLQTQKLFYKRILFPFLKRNVKGWLFLSTEELNKIKSDKSLNDNNIFLTKNIVSLERFKKEKNFRNDLHIPADYKILLFVGRLIKEKGIHYIIDAFAEIKMEYKTILIIVGDGEETENIKAKIALLNLEKEVILTGWIKESEVDYFTSNSDLLIFPTFFSEGFPMALFNSLAAGLPIVTTQTRAAIDYLKEPDNCLWVQPRSSDSIKTAIIKLLNDDCLTKQMQENNIKKSYLFTQEVVAKELSSILTSIKERS